MTTVKWGGKASAETAMTTELNALAGFGIAITATPVSNNDAGELYLYADFQLSLALMSSSRSSGAMISLYILPEVDGAYPYGDNSLAPQTELLVGAFTFDAATTARDATLKEVLLPPSDFHLIIINYTGATLANSGNVLKMERYNREAV